MFFASTLNLIDSSFDIASEIRTAVQSKSRAIFTYDNATAIAFSTASIGGRAMRRAFDLVFAALWFVGCLGFYCGQAFGQDHYKVRAAALAIETEDLAVVQVWPGADEMHHEPDATHRYMVQLVKGRTGAKTLDCAVVGGGYAELQSAVRAACPGWRMANWELVWEVSV